MTVGFVGFGARGRWTQIYNFISHGLTNMAIPLTNGASHSPSMKCVTLAHHALAHDWSNISLATIANGEWLVTSNWLSIAIAIVRSALCLIDASQQTNATGSCVLFVKEFLFGL